MELNYTATRDLRGEPVLIKAAGLPDGITSLVTANGMSFPAQNTEGGVLAILTLAKGTRVQLRPYPDAAGARPIRPWASVPCTADKGVVITENKAESKLDVAIGGKYFTSYCWTDRFIRPYLGPVMAGDGETSYTRLDFDVKEHPHQRSVFVGIGDINGTVFWGEQGEDRGVEHPQGVTDVWQGAAAGGFTAHNLWTDVAGTRLLDEDRTFVFYRQNCACRYVDIKIKLRASYRTIEVGGTKEAGPLGIRVNEQLRVDKGTGHMTNSYGAENESECWGRSAHWCDYSGTIDGKPFGIAVFDNEKNERYPTAWHIRDYGLFAPNNLLFKGGFTIPVGESVTYRYRMVFHENKPHLRERFVSYCNSEQIL